MARQEYRFFCVFLVVFLLKFYFIFLRFLLQIGIGRDLCERLDGMGAIVYAISRSIEPLNELKKTCPKVKAIQIDLSNWSNAKDQLTQALKNVKIDGLVNNAGVAICKPIGECSEKDFDE